MKRAPLSDAERSRNRMARLKARAEAAQEMECLFADILCAPSLKQAREIARRGMALSDASRRVT
jgi:hypothetical protein